MANDSHPSRLVIPASRLVAAIVAALALASPVSLGANDAALLSARNSITAGESREIVDFLASDALEGRGVGTRGGRAAANYLVKTLTDLKVTPAGTGRSWFQAFHPNARNILGVIPGSDPTLSKEYVLVGAHYDHVGYGNENNSYGPVGYIHNGADDNASGVAALLEVVEAVQALPTPPKRSILFALWDGEEDGLLGSIHWCNNPTVPLSSVKLAFNMDMVGRLRNKTVEVYGTRTAPGLRQLVSRWNADELNLNFTWEMKADSDHHSFFEKRVPVLMFHTGLHDQYHRPSDDPETVDHNGIELVSKLMFGVIVDAADRPTLGAFRRASERETEDLRLALAARAGGSRPARFGVAWREREQDPPSVAGRPGVTLTRVVPGSPADLAGLRLGDRLTAFNGVEVTSSAQLRRAIATSPPEASVELLRPDAAEPVKAAVTLRGAAIRVGLSWRDDDAEPGVVVIQYVAPDSPAEAAGLKIGDRLHSVDGRGFKNADDLRAIFAELGGSIPVEIERTGKHAKVAIELDARVARR